MNQTHKLTAHAGVSGQFKVDLLNPDGSVEREGKMQRNLIMDHGLDYFFATVGLRLTDAINYGYAGTGNTPNTETPDGTFSQAGTTITRDTGTGQFEAGDAGRYVGFADGTQAKIVTFTSATEVEVDRTQTVAAQGLTIYRTDQTGMEAYDHQGNAKVPDEESNVIDTAAKTVTCTRVILLNAVGGSVNVTEVGLGDGTHTPNGFWSRIVLDEPIAMSVGQQLKLTYVLTFTFDPDHHADTDTGITGFPHEYQIQSITDQGANVGRLTLDGVGGSHHLVVGSELNISGALRPKIAISSVTSTASDFTVTTSAAHGLSASDSIVIEGCSPSAYNNTWTVASVGSTTEFTVTSAANPGAGSGGTVREANPGTWWDGQYTITAVGALTVDFTKTSGVPDAGVAGVAKNNRLATVANLGGVSAFTGGLTGDATPGNEFGWFMNTVSDSYDIECLIYRDGSESGTIPAWGAHADAGIPDETRNISTREAYVNGSFERVSHVFEFSPAVANFTDIRQIAIAEDPPSGHHDNAFIVRFNELQRKDNTHKLVVKLTKRLTRTLTA